MQRYWWMALALLGCQEAEVETTVVDPIVDPAAPFTGPAVDNPALYPALAAHGRLPEGTFSNVTPGAAHTASFTDGVQLAPPPTTNPSSDAPGRDAWGLGLGSVANVDTLQAPKLSTHMREALASADARLGAVSTAALDAAAAVFSYIPGFTHKTWPVQQQFTTWALPRARWLAAQWHTTAAPSLPYPETRYQYPTPSGLAAAPDRGARLYCAAREVARHQHGGSLGEQVLLPLSILGQHLDIGVLEPTAFVDQPEKFTGGTASDGAQAFNIPMTLGALITPIRPLLPALPELRFPVVLTAVDSELETNVGKQVIFEPQHCVITPFGQFCTAVPRVDYRYRYKTIAHADAASSANAAVTANASFPVFWAGPLLVQLQLAFGAAVGTTVPRDPPLDKIPPARPTVFDDRILKLGLPPVGWPTSANRPGTASPPYLDGYWRLAQSYVPGDPNPEVFDVRNVDGGTDTHAASIGLGPTTSLRAQIVADDDHHIAPTSELALSGTIDAGIDFNAGLASIHIGASGTLGGALGLAHDIRDGVYANTGGFSNQPIAAVTVTPTGYGSVALNFQVGFHLHISLFISDIDVDYKLIDKDIPLGAPFETPWDESHRLRIGTESTLGEPMQSPDVDSHIGADAPFKSFPPTMPSVAACLADPSSVPPPPTACQGPAATGTPPRVETCMYMPVSIQIDPCIDIPPVTDLSDDTTRCLHAELTYLCGATSQEQWFHSEYVLAHRLALDPAVTTDPDDLIAISNIANACAAAEAASIPPGPTGASDWFKSRFTFAPCDAAATLHDATDVITTTGPSDVHAGTCH